jgi:hypothetical protein
MIDAALVAVVAKDLRCELATRITVDAGGIDKEISGDVFRKALLDVCHDRISFSDNDAPTSGIQVNTGSAGVPPAMSAKREKGIGKCFYNDLRAFGALRAG